MRQYHLTGRESYNLQSTRRTKDERDNTRRLIIHAIASDAAYDGEVVQVIDPARTVVFTIDLTETAEEGEA